MQNRWINQVMLAAGMMLFMLVFPSVLRSAEQTGPLRVLFLGDQGHHKPAERFAQLAGPLGQRGIRMTYTEAMSDLNAQRLASYDALMVYANIDQIAPDQARAVLDYVAAGGGYVPIHCASFCFRNSAEMVALTGGEFKSHKTGTFRTTTVSPDHPIMQGFEDFESWDETYVHHKHNEKDRTVLSVRVEDDHREPWTWVRTQGKGRVFYTAWGHDHRTWSNPGFQELIYRGTLWAAGDAAAARLTTDAETRKNRPPLQYEPRPTVQNYEKRDPYPQYQLPLSPRDSMAYTETEPGFRLELFVSEPDIVKPIALAWDHRGRLWIAETVDYPNTLTDQEQGSDRIKICEDTDGDGRADKFTVFADKLNIPTGLVLVNGGVLVSQAPHFLFFKDTNGDDKADVRQVVLSGWGKGDTHAGPSNLAYGLDNRIYGSVGYSNFKGTVGGVEQSFGRGIYALKRDYNDIEFLTQYSNNTWGFGQSEDGERFGSTANNTHHMFTAIPNRYFAQAGLETGSGSASEGGFKMDAHYAAHALTQKIRQVDVFGGFTAAAGHRIYTARAYPEKYWNRAALVCEPTMHLVHQGFLKREGSGWTEDGDGMNLVASEDEWFGPVYAEVGPDGAVWVADWYNFIIQHNPTPNKDRGGFDAKNGKGNAHENPLRDKVHGRIYRVVWNGQQPAARKSVNLQDAADLLAALGDSNLFWRLTAQRLLVERGKKDVVPQLIEQTRDQTVDAVGLNGGVIHALWTLHGLGELDGSNASALSAAVAALKHPSAAVRKNAAQVLPLNEAGASALAGSGILEDADLNARLRSWLAAADMPASEALGAALYEAARRPETEKDTWLPKAAAVAAAAHASGFLKAASAAGEKRMANAAGPSDARNLITNASFEEVAGDKPRGWEVRHYNGQAAHAYVEGGRTGKRCLEIRSDAGADTSWFTQVAIEPKTRYRLSAWIKTENVTGAEGALLNPHELQGLKTAPKLQGTKDWQKVSIEFGSGDRRDVTINCLFGGWGQSRGVAWYDDIELVKIGSSGSGGLDPVAVAADAMKKHPETEQQALLAVLASGDPGLAAFVTGRITGKIKTPETGADTSPVDVTITLKTVPEKMLYDQKKISVKAGQRVRLILENPDPMLHNLILGKPGSLQKLGAAADAMLTDPQAMDRHFIPEHADILQSTRLIPPGGRAVLTFTAPREPGDYPYLCTFPGHWRIMNGVMTVTP